MVFEHKISLKRKELTIEGPGGSRARAARSTFKQLEDMALARIDLKKNGVREPHWHPNSDELTYCLEGKALITLFSPGNTHDQMTLEAGEVVFIPRGYTHCFENIHEGETRFLLGFNNGDPNEINFSTAISSMSAHTQAATFGVADSVFEPFVAKQRNVIISKQKQPKLPAYPSIPNHHKLNLERANPLLVGPGGNGKVANGRTFPMLDRLALVSLRMVEGAVREPHWHPNATECNYVISGKAKMTILSPDGELDTYTMEPGEGSIIPASYYHHIENAGKGELHMAVYFNNAIPTDIGLSGALGAYSDEVLASLFDVDPKVFANLPKFQEDVLVVKGGG